VDGRTDRVIAPGAAPGLAVPPAVVPSGPDGAVGTGECRRRRVRPADTAGTGQKGGHEQRDAAAPMRMAVEVEALNEALTT
jgi:hypothetical protein